MFLNINSDAVVKFTNKLEQLRRSALPVAIRGALNDAVKDVKMNTMPAKAAIVFINRSPNFFKANSKFEYAVGFDVNTMRSAVGFYENNLSNKGTNFAVKDLEEQENSGDIGGRSFKPLPAARKGNSARGLVKPNLRISLLKNLVKKTSDAKGKSWGQKAIAASAKAGVGGFVLDNHKTKGVLWRVDALLRVGRNMTFKKTALYAFNKNGHVRIKATNFMKTASLETNRKLEGFYIAQAQKQIAKIMD